MVQIFSLVHAGATYIIGGKGGGGGWNTISKYEVKN